MCGVSQGKDLMVITAHGSIFPGKLLQPCGVSVAMRTSELRKYYSLVKVLSLAKAIIQAFKPAFEFYCPFPFSVSLLFPQGLKKKKAVQFSCNTEF